MLIPLVNDPLVPDAEEAQRLLQEELARSEYSTESWDFLTRILDKISEFFLALLGIEGYTISLEAALIVGFMLLLIVAIGITFFHPIRLAARRSSAVVDDDDVTLQEAQERLAQAVGAQQWNDAVVWSFRCATLLLDELMILSLTAGVTAQEVSRSARERFPDQRDEFTFAASIFDKVRYGDADATQEDYSRLAALLAVIETRRGH